MIKGERLAIPEVVAFEPKVFSDARGAFFESYNASEFEEIVGRQVTFAQDNQSESSRGVLRGLHYQLSPYAQGKLVRVVSGEILDVAVDLRSSSHTFGRWVSVHLNAENKKQLWVPEGFAHGFLTLSEKAIVLYKATNFYSPESERSVIWNDEDIGIQWPLMEEPILSTKDLNAPRLSEAEVFE